jgi:FkbH-like protein
VQQQLNIGLDSIAFVDDSPFEREQMKTMLPEVRVYDQNIFEKLLYMPEFQPEYVTNESKKRAAFYIQENQRRQARKINSKSRDEFLEQCNFVIDIEKMQPYQMDRVCELIQRTNQLNTSIKRYTKEQVIAFSHENDCDIFTVTVSDKFGDYGLVGVCIGFHRQDVYEIDTLLFSCRIMSRGVEDYTLTSVLNYAKEKRFGKVILRFEKGPKNDQMRTILSNNNFAEFEDNGSSVVYGLNLQQQQIKSLPKWFSSTQSNSTRESMVTL